MIGHPVESFGILIISNILSNTKKFAENLEKYKTSLNEELFEKTKKVASIYNDLFKVYRGQRINLQREFELHTSLLSAYCGEELPLRFNNKTELVEVMKPELEIVKYAAVRWDCEQQDPIVGLILGIYGTSLDLLQVNGFNCGSFPLSGIRPASEVEIEQFVDSYKGDFNLELSSVFQKEV
jgi:hypothetical protein